MSILNSKDNRARPIISTRTHRLFSLCFAVIISLLMITNGIILITPNVSSRKGGPDSFGYRWIDSNTTTSPSTSYNWLDGVTGGTDLSLGNDQTSAYIDLGFRFPFYEVSYSSIAVCSNGWATFKDSGYTTKTSNPLPYTLKPNALIAPFWTDLNPGQHGKVNYKVNNQTSPKHFIITWDNVPLNMGSYQYNQTFEAVIYENGSILFQYKSVNLTQSMIPVVGIEDHDGKNGLGYSYFLENGSAIWYFYNYAAHDLNLKNVKVKSYSSVNEELEIKATIENFGYSVEDKINLSLKVNSVPINWTGPVITLNPFQSTEHIFYWTPATQGNHTVGVQIEPVSGETKTDNNYIGKTVDVRNWRGKILYDRTHGGWMEDYTIWFSDLKSKNIIVEELTSGDVTSQALEGYSAIMLAYAYQTFTGSELTAVHNFINSGHGLIILGRYYDNVYNPLTSPYEITWYDHDGSSGNTNDITAHEITTGVQTAYLYYVRSELEVTGAAQGLIYDTSKDRALVCAISNESGPGRVACYSEPYGFDDYRINNVNNRPLATQIMEWVIGDDRPPAKPRGFKASDGKLGNQINLSWTPNTEKDLKGYYLYRGNTSGVYDPDPIYIPAGGSKYNDKGSHLTDHTEYFYVLAAIDEVPNISQFSVESKATPTDRIAPRTPYNFSIIDMGVGDQLKISWNKNKESDIVEYRLYKADNFDFTDQEIFIIPPDTTFYMDSEVIEGKNYYYKVSAVDEVPNESHLTPVKVGTAYDRIPPSQPTQFNATDPGLGNTAKLTWAPNHNDDDLKDYLVERKDSKGIIKKLSVSIAEHYNSSLDLFVYYDSNNLEDGRKYSYRLYARDDSLLKPPNLSPPTEWINVTPTDITPPSIPQNFTISDESFYTTTGPVHCLNLSWNMGSDIDLRGFIVYRFDFANFKLSEKKILVNLGLQNHYKDFNVEEGVEYYYKVTAYDEIPNESPPSVELLGVPGDITPPPMPKQFKVEALPEGAAVKLTWVLQQGTEIEGYKLYYRNNLNQSDEFYLLAEFDKNSDEYLHTGLVNDLQYFYKLQTFDAIPNYSPFTSIHSVTPSDILPPNKPVGLKIELIETGRAVKLSWKSNTDEDLEGYRVYRSLTTTYSLVMAVGADTTSVIDTGLENKQTYRYYITAIDEVPNESDRSTIKNAIPEDNVAPSTPTDLSTSIPDSKDRIILTWNPSNDSDVNYYHIFRSSDNKDFKEIAKISFIENTYNDFDVDGGETYYYRISAGDDVPNLSPRSKEIKVEMPHRSADQLSDELLTIIVIIVIVIIIILLALAMVLRKRKRSRLSLAEAEAQKAREEQEHEAAEAKKAKGGLVQTITVTPGALPTTTQSTPVAATSKPLPGVSKVTPPALTSPTTTTQTPSLPTASATTKTEPQLEPQPEPQPQPAMDQIEPDMSIPEQMTMEQELVTAEEPIMPTMESEPSTPPTPIMPSEPETVQTLVQKPLDIKIIPPEEKSKPLPVILIPVDDGTGEPAIEGVKHDKKGHLTIMDPKVINAPRFPLRKPPVGKIVKRKEKEEN
jgi:fibronectin type 3 domain-containing protein/type II secretory pathway pseudopilin PulG